MLTKILSITADTDDQIDIKISGADDFRFTANTFTALAGSGIVVPDGGLTFGSTAISATAAEINLDRWWCLNRNNCCC